MGSNFLKLTKELGVNCKQPYFNIKKQKYFYLFDPPHLIKSIRNNLMKYDTSFENENKRYTASCKYIEDFFEKDSGLKFRAAPKLTKDHIYPTNFKKMKVKFASQVCSHTVAAGLYTHASLNSLPLEATEAADFLSLFDQLFDCSNSSTSQKATPK